MRIRLTQIDGKLPSLALKKLAHYHRARGDERFTRRIERQRGEPTYDRVYGSAIFSFSADRVRQFKRQFPDAIVGGTHDIDVAAGRRAFGCALLLGKLPQYALSSPSPPATWAQQMPKLPQAYSARVPRRRLLLLQRLSAACLPCANAICDHVR